MNLYDQHPYWLMKNGIIAQYPSLDSDLNVDVAIMGAGISAALMAWHLRNDGPSVAVMDSRHAGLGSTAASTAFLQYEIDTPLTELIKRVGEKNAVSSYRLCRKAIYDIQQLCKALKPAFDFHLRPSLQQASFKSHVGRLKEEYELRVKHGFAVDWLEEKEVEAKFGFRAPAGILSADGGEVDAYLLTHALLKNFQASGHRVYNNTRVKAIYHHQQGLTLHTSGGLKIKAKKLIIACGYESLKYVPKKIADIHTTYALISEPLSEAFFWYKNSLVWETAEPYLYFRIADKNRILIGGRDDTYHRPHIAPSVISRKTKELVTAFLKKLPDIPLKADFSWAGAFAVTKDGLPYIGCIPERPHTYFALGFGGNGITFSVIAAQLIRDMILDRKNEDYGLFDFNR